MNIKTKISYIICIKIFTTHKKYLNIHMLEFYLQNNKQITQ